MLRTSSTVRLLSLGSGFAVAALVGLVGLVGLSALAGCSSDDTGGTGGVTPEAGGGGEGGKEGGGGEGGAVDAGADAAPVVLNDCKTFLDLSAPGANRTIPWKIPLIAPERCMTIKKGQEITWSGDFVEHPLIVKGGDMPNPVANVDAAGKVTFAAAGLFGYECMTHQSMTGAIKVIE